MHTQLHAVDHQEKKKMPLVKGWLKPLECVLSVRESWQERTPHLTGEGSLREGC